MAGHLKKNKNQFNVNDSSQNVEIGHGACPVQTNDFPSGIPLGV